jgi:hypothetical protein
MITSKHLQVFLYVAVGIWALLLVISGTQIGALPYKPWSTAVGIAVFLAGLLDKYAWRWRIFRSWLVSTPDIQGTWKGQLISNYIDQTTNLPIVPRDVYLVARQTMSTISVRLVTQESASQLLGGSIVQEADDVYEVVGLYRNTPRLLSQANSPIHHGALLLNIYGKPPNTLNGCYWTDRGTKGELKFERKISTLCYDFDSAVQAFTQHASNQKTYTQQS